MSRLERMIARLLTQRACIGEAARLIGDLGGPVLEIGLGKGRTYSHLRATLPDREIFAFDRDVHAPPDSVPDVDHLLLGDFRDTLSDALHRIGRRAALAHADIGTEDRRADEALAQLIAHRLVTLVAPGGVVLTDREMRVGGLSALPLPEVPLPQGIGPWTYFMYRLTAV